MAYDRRHPASAFSVLPQGGTAGSFNPGEELRWMQGEKAVVVLLRSGPPGLVASAQGGGAPSLFPVPAELPHSQLRK